MIRDTGLIATIGYLITEAETIWITGNDGHMGLVLDSAGRIYVAYTRWILGGGYDLAIFRLTTGGALDTTFDGDGIRTIEFGGTDNANAVAIDSAGRIIVVGASTDGPVRIGGRMVAPDRGTGRGPLGTGGPRRSARCRRGSGSTAHPRSPL